MRKAFGWFLLYGLLVIGMSDYYFKFSDEQIVGSLSVVITVILTANIAFRLIGDDI